jgi:hypothetical protein
MKIYLNGQVAHYKEIFPNVSFPADGPSDEFLVSAGAYKVSMFRSHTATQKLVPCSPVVENGFAYVVKVENKTAEEIASDNASKASKLRAARDKALADSDWTQVADAPVDKEAWATYRQSLRDLPNSNGWPDVSLPTEPGFISGNSD